MKTEAKRVKGKTATAPSSLASVLEQSHDWVLQVDLTIPRDGQKRNTPFPAHIGDGESAFSSRPDLIIFSDKLKHILYIELTSPWEGPRMEESHKEKMDSRVMLNSGMVNHSAVCRSGRQGDYFKHISPHAQSSWHVKPRIEATGQ